MNRYKARLSMGMMCRIRQVLPAVFLFGVATGTAVALQSTGEPRRKTVDRLIL